MNIPFDKVLRGKVGKKGITERRKDLARNVSVRKRGKIKGTETVKLFKSPVISRIVNEGIK